MSFSKAQSSASARSGAEARIYRGVFSQFNQKRTPPSLKPAHRGPTEYVVVVFLGGGSVPLANYETDKKTIESNLASFRIDGRVFYPSRAKLGVRDYGDSDFKVHEEFLRKKLTEPGEKRFIFVAASFGWKAVEHLSRDLERLGLKDDQYELIIDQAATGLPGPWGNRRPKVSFNEWPVKPSSVLVLTGRYPDYYGEPEFIYEGKIDRAALGEVAKQVAPTDKSPWHLLTEPGEIHGYEVERFLADMLLPIVTSRALGLNAPTRRPLEGILETREFLAAITRYSYPSYPGTSASAKVRDDNLPIIRGGLDKLPNSVRSVAIYSADRGSKSVYEAAIAKYGPANVLNLSSDLFDVSSAQENYIEIPRSTIEGEMVITPTAFRADAILVVPNSSALEIGRANRPIVAVRLTQPLVHSPQHDEVWPRQGRWHNVQDASWKAPVYVLDGSALGPAEIAAEVATECEALGLPRGESIVVGGTVGSARTTEVVKALQTAGHFVEVVDTSALTYNESLEVVAKRAHELGAHVGVVLRKSPDGRSVTTDKAFKKHQVEKELKTERPPDLSQPPLLFCKCGPGCFCSLPCQCGGSVTSGGSGGGTNAPAGFASDDDDQSPPPPPPARVLSGSYPAFLLLDFQPFSSLTRDSATVQRQAAGVGPLRNIEVHK